MATASSVLAVIRAYRPHFRHIHDKVAFALHAAFLSAGCSATAVGSHAHSFSEPPPFTETSIDGWNDMEDGYAFCYEKNEDGKKLSIIVKGIILEDSVIFDSTVFPNFDWNIKSNIFDLQINVQDFANENGEVQNFADHYKDLKGLIEKINSSYISKFDEMLKPKPTVSTSATISTARADKSRPGEKSVHTFPEPRSSPLEDYGRNVFPYVPSIGGDDLVPGPGAGIYPQRPGLGAGGGSMLLGPNDPMWRGGGNFPGHYPANIGGVPPGARFDPFGPPGVPGFEPERFLRHPRAGRGSDVHPDLEHFKPF